MSKKWLVAGLAGAALLVALVGWLILGRAGPMEPALERLDALADRARAAESPQRVVAEAAKLNDRRLVPRLVELMNDPSPAVQWLAAEGLRAVAAPGSRDALMRFVKRYDFDAMERQERDGSLGPRDFKCAAFAVSAGILALGEIGDPSVIPLLESMRNVKQLQFEFGGGPVETALAKLGAEGLKSLSAPNDNSLTPRMLKAQSAIERISDPRRIPQLIATVRDPACSVYIRSAALTALGGMHSEPGVVDFLLSVACDRNEDAYLRGIAANGANQLGIREVEAALEELAASDPSARVGVFAALSHRNRKKYLGLLIDCIKDRNLPEKERDKAASVMESVSLSTPRDLAVHAVALKECLTSDYGLSDNAKTYCWKALYRTTGEAVPIKLRNRHSLHRLISFVGQMLRSKSPEPWKWSFGKAQRAAEEIVRPVVTLEEMRP